MRTLSILLFIFLMVMLMTMSCSGSESSQQPANPVPENAFGVQPLLIGESVPGLSVTDIEGHSLPIVELVSGRPSVIIFYRGGWCPFCSAHLAELATFENEIYDLGYQLLAISPDQPEFLRQSLEDQGLNYTLLSDSSMEVARAFGVAFRVDDEAVSRLKENGMDIVQRSGQDHQQLPVPAVFIANPSGEILFQYVNPNYRERINGDILIEALRTFRE